MAKTRYVVRPQPRLQKLQREIRKQFGTYKSTYLAKVNGAVRLPGGIFWTHDATGTDANGNTTYGAPRKMLMLPGAAIFPRPNTKVDVVTIHGIDYIARTNSHELERMGVDPHQSNTLDPVVQYKALDFIINLQAFKTPGASSTHIIGSIYKKPNGYYDVLPTTGGYDFVTANIPTTDMQVVVCQWVNTDDNTVTATVSSEVSRDIDLKHPDNLADVLTLINECVDAAPTNHIGVNAWRIYDDTTIATLSDTNKLADLRGIIGAGGVSGATTALDNLASIAINTSLVSDTDSTDDLGSTAKYWANTYTDTLYVSEQAAPSTPASGKAVIYAKTDGKVYSKDDAGTEYDLTAGSGGSGYTTVQEEGSSLTARSTINFVGAGVTATDDGSKTVVTIPSGTPDLIILQDQKTQNTQGGTFTSGAWRTRDLNTEVVDTGSHCTLSGNQFTLGAGTYRLTASAFAFAVGSHQLRIQNTTDATTTITGLTQYAQPSVALSGNLAYVEGRFTIASSKTFELQHRCSSTKSTDGFGVAANFTTEIYSTVRIEKE